MRWWISNRIQLCRMNWTEKETNFSTLSPLIIVYSEYSVFTFVQFWQIWIFWGLHNFLRNLDCWNLLHLYHEQRGTRISLQINNPFSTTICSANIAIPIWQWYLGIYIFCNQTLSFTVRSLFILLCLQRLTAAFFFQKIHLNK